MSRFLKSVVAVAVLAALPSIASADTFVRMVSGPAGGSWYPLGAKIAEVLGKEVPGIATSNGPGGGVGNVKDVSSGNAELGWTYAHTAYNGHSGRGKFEAAYPNVRHFATLYPAALQTVVPKSSAIQNYADMKDKSLSPGKKTYSGYAAAEIVFNEYGLTFDQVKDNGGTIHHVGYTDSVSLMKDGHLDVFIAMTSVPQASLIDLDFNPGVRFIGIEDSVMDKILSENPGYLKTVIPASAYKGMTEDVPTLGVVTILVVQKDLPDDVVYNLAKALWENHGEFVKVKSVWNEVKLEDALRGAAIPVHPGAQRYYDEKGVMKK